MKTSKNIIAIVLLMMMYSCANQGNKTEEESQQITFTLNSINEINLELAANAENTTVKIMSGNEESTSFEVGSELTQIKYIPKDKRVSIYGNISTLDCSRNGITSLDISNNTVLKELNCGINELSSLNTSKNIALTKLNCDYNKLTSLDLSNNTSLKTLSYRVNQLENLNISNNKALVELDCCGNGVRHLDISKNSALEYLICSSNKLKSLDISKNRSLTSLVCGDNNELNNLNLSNKVLNYIDCSGSSINFLNTLFNSLPDRNGMEKGMISLMEYDSENIIDSHKNIAEEKNWEIRFEH